MSRKTIEIICDIHKLTNASTIEALEIIKPYLANDAQSRNINLRQHFRQGGTFLSNWNLTTNEATVLVDVLKELECNCFYIIPAPAPIGFPPNVQQVIADDMLIALNQISDILSRPLNLYSLTEMSRIQIYPMMSVHSNSPRRKCGEMYREIALAHCAENEEIMRNATMGRMIREDAIDETNSFMKKIMMRKED